MRVLKSVAVWLLILALALLNGLFREAVLLPSLSQPAAFMISGWLLSACIIVVATGLARWLELTTVRRSFLMGCLWLGLTLVFEFSFGGLVQGKSWAAMLEAYTFKDGNIWPMVLMVTLFAPLIASRIHRLRRGHAHEIVEPAAPGGRSAGEPGSRARTSPLASHTKNTKRMNPQIVIRSETAADAVDGRVIGHTGDACSAPDPRC